MKKIIRIVIYLVLILVVVVTALLTYVKVALPDVGPAEEITIAYTPERIARGRYLAHSVAVCMDCHSTRDWTRFSGPPANGTLGKGGDRFDQTMGLPGVFYARNITPEGIQRYSDGELFRVITTGVNKEGTAMFPLMPYPYYGKMDREDIYDIIAYIRTLRPIKNDVPASSPEFPMNFIINTIPQKGDPQVRPDTADVMAYGAYLTNASGCVECHSPVRQGQVIKKLSFSGGREFRSPDGAVVRSANITPDKKTGIGSWTEVQFIARFKAFAKPAHELPAVKPGEFNTIMPWSMYGSMKEQDLAAIFTYLKSVDPIENKVTVFSPPAAAK